MEKHYLPLIIDEIKNFKKLQKLFDYSDLPDLISHYIEEGVITSKKELINVLETLNKQLGILVEEKIFDDWWNNRK